jgi:hypothetical protein
LLTDAIDAEFTVHVAAELTSAVEPSLYFAVAVNCSDSPDWTLAVAGVTASEERVFVPPELPLLLPETPWHAIPAIVKAIVEIVKTEKGKKRRFDFIHSLLSGYSVRVGLGTLGADQANRVA